jgi:hypothetical protein
MSGTASGSGRLGPDPNPDIWDRIRIIAFINDSIPTCLVWVKLDPDPDVFLKSNPDPDFWEDLSKKTTIIF